MRMGRTDKEEFDWLNDPFDEKKAAREQARAATSGGTKIALGCGCLVAVVGVVIIAVLMLAGIADIAAS